MKKILKTVSFLVLLSSSCFAYDFATLKSLTRTMVRDNNADSSLWHFSDIIVSSFCNMAQEEICQYTFCLNNSTSMTLLDGQRYYNMPTDFFVSQRVTLNKEVLPQKSITKLDDTKSWEVPSGSATPTYYFIRNGTYTLFGFDVVPSTETYNEITVEYTAIPTSLSSSTDIPFNRSARLYPYHVLISYYTAAMLCYSDNRETEGDRWYAFYTQRLKDMSTTIRLTPDYSPSISIK